MHNNNNNTTSHNTINMARQHKIMFPCEYDPPRLHYTVSVGFGLSSRMKFARMAMAVGM